MEAAARPTNPNQAKNKDVGQRPFPQCFGQTFESWDAIVTGYTATGLPSRELTHLGPTHSGGSVLQPIPLLCFTCSLPVHPFFGFIFLSLQIRLVQVSSLVPNTQYNPLSPGVSSLHFRCLCLAFYCLGLFLPASSSGSSFPHFYSLTCSFSKPTPKAYFLSWQTPFIPLLGLCLASALSTGSLSPSLS